MTTRFWVKLYIEILDDPKMGRLTNHMWRRAVELFLLAGREGNDGALPPVEEMAWILRLSEDKVLEDLHGLAEVGVVHAAEPGVWFVTHFAQRQAAVPVEERVRRFRARNADVTKRYKSCNEEAGVASTSTSISNSDPVSSEEGVQGEEPQAVPRLPASSAARPPGMGPNGAETAGESPENYGDGEDLLGLPSSPVEAMLHPDVRVFAAVTGGRIPGLSQYRTVIDAVRFLRGRERMDDQALAVYLTPYWLAWSSRKRLDGRSYDPGNITWLTEWALNGSVPSGKEPAISKGKADVIKEVAGRKNGRG